jgi:hypothetical protein
MVWRIIGCVVWQKEEVTLLPQIDTEFVDLKVMTAAIQHCKDTHRGCCTRPFSGKVPFMKLIDCRTREVFLAESRPDLPYAALSYVWGSVEHTVEHAKVLPRHLPATIEDAISIANGMGFQYLWIDRYCIDQQNKQEVSHQIAVMDKIYQNADLTIITACGKDPSYGLPGIRNKRNNKTRTARFGGVNFIVPLWESPGRVQNSKWNTRAWTYQEAVFSRRRLVFLDDQVYYDCQSTHWYESWKPPSMLLNDRISKLSRGHAHRLPQGYKANMTQLQAISYIEDYSERSLGVPEDIINALSGLLHAFDVDIGFHHYWGVPVSRQPPELDGFRQPSWSDSAGFFFGLTWVRSRSFTNSITSGQRRRFAPSWSWAGWEGSVTWQSWHPSKHLFHGHEKDNYSVDPEAKFQVELLDGRVLDWDDILNIEITTRQSLLSHFVHITTITTPVIIEKKPYLLNGIVSEPESNEYNAVAEVDDDDACVVFNFLADMSEPIPPNCIAIHLIQASLRSKFGNRACKAHSTLLLLVGQINGRFERVGVVWDAFAELVTPHIQSRYSGKIQERYRDDLTEVEESIMAQEAYDRMKKIRQTIRLA